MKSHLLCTFAHPSDIKVISHYIYQNYDLERDNIFVFENLDDWCELFLTYNVMEITHFIENTITIHRKKDSNTLYTINSLNEIIRKANNGVLDKSFPIDWFRYENTLLLSLDGNVRKIKLKLKNVIKF